MQSRIAAATGGRVHRLLRTRGVGSQARRWFHAVSVHPPSTGRRVGAWIMEYHEDHLTALGLPAGAAPTRSEYLQALRRARGASTPTPARLLSDVARIDLALTGDERDDLATLLLAGGWSRTDPSPSETRLSRSGLDVHVRVGDAPRQRLRSIGFVLTRAPDEEVELAFGPRSTLTVRTDGRARWTFR